jgi:hypothetical protein
MMFEEGAVADGDAQGFIRLRSAASPRAVTTQREPYHLWIFAYRPRPMP